MPGRARHDKLEIRHDKLEIRHDKLEIRHDKLEIRHDKLETRHDKLAVQHDKRCHGLRPRDDGKVDIHWHALAQPRIERVAQPVAQQIHTQRNQDQHQAREHGDPPFTGKEVAVTDPDQRPQ